MPRKLGKGDKMTKEEILEKSQNENKGRDVADIAVSQKSIMFGWIVTVCLAGVVAVLNGIILNQGSYGMFFAIMGGSFTIFLRKYIKFRRGHELFITIAYGIATVAFLCAWIISLVNG